MQLQRYAFFALSIGMMLWSGSAFSQEGRTTGLMFLEEDRYRSIPLATPPLLGDLPTDVDLSANFPLPGQQGAQSSCVGWAVANLKAYQEQVERKWGLNSRSHQFSPAYIYNQIKTSQDCRGGSNFEAALNLLRRSGMATLSDFPYDESSCDRLPGQAIVQRSQQFAIADWRRVNVQDETEIKTQIAAGFPILIGMSVDDGFSNLRSGAIYSSRSGNSRGGHAMVGGGFADDSRAF